MGYTTGKNTYLSFRQARFGHLISPTRSKLEVPLYGSGDTIKETVVYAERNKILAYQIAFPSMVKDHLSIIEIKENGRGSSTIRVYAYFTPTEWTGYLMKFGVYANIVKGSLKN